MQMDEIRALRGEQGSIKPITQRDRLLKICDHKLPNGQAALRVITEDSGGTTLLCDICGTKISTTLYSMNDINNAFNVVDNMYQQMKIYLNPSPESSEFLKTFCDFLLICQTGKELYGRFVKDSKNVPQANQPGSNFFRTAGQGMPYGGGQQMYGQQPYGQQPMYPPQQPYYPQGNMYQQQQPYGAPMMPPGGYYDPNQPYFDPRGQR